MKTIPRLFPHLLTTLLLAAAIVGCDKSKSSGGVQGDLNAAIAARTEVTELQMEVIKLEADVRDVMRKVIAKADAKQTEGNILLTKDRYDDAVAAFKESSKLYRQVADGRKLLDQLAKAERNAATSRLLAESTAKPEQLAEGRKLQTNAEGYQQAGEFDAALAEFDKARKAYEKLLPSQGAATLEQAVTARTAMLSARDQIKNLPRIGSLRDDDELRTLQRRLGMAGRDSTSASAATGPKPGSLADLTSRAQKAESAANEALEERQYGPARALFTAAEKIYREAAAAQSRREAVLASRESADAERKKADAAFKGNARPASFERGNQALKDADKALADDDLDTVKKHLADAASQFAAARAEADQVNALGDAQQAWSAALASTDEDLLNKHAAAGFQTARASAAEAQTKAGAGQTAAATAQFKQALATLTDAVATARTKENTAKAAPIFARLETAVSGKEKFHAEQLLAELTGLVPADSRLAGLRQSAAALPWPATASVDLGGGVSMELVLVRPGSFMMGSDSGASDEKPVRKVTLTQPFYMGKYEVTQAQWEAVMGSNPSHFKGPKLPVETVSWNDCQTFMAKLQEKTGRKFALPTEAQWEYACRAGGTGKYSFGDSDTTLAEHAWYSANAGGQTHPAGEKKPNAWGLHDLHGNVWEWCADWHGSYPAGEASDPSGPASGNARVLRGGSWVVGSSALRSSSATTARRPSPPSRVALCGGGRVGSLGGSDWPFVL